MEEGGDYYANFQPVAGNYVVTVVCNPEGAATINGAGSYAAGSTCTLSFVANEGYEFLMWSVGGAEVSTDEAYSFIVTEDVTVEAQFTTDVYIISATPNPTSAGTVTGAGGYTYNQVCTLTATPNEGYVFSNWTLNGMVVSTENPYIFNVTEAGDYQANFVEGVIITVSSNPENAGIVTGGGTYAIGATCTVSATPNPGSDFLFWTVNDEVVSTDLTYTFTATESAEYVANFSQEIFIITVTANPTVAGTVSGGGGFTYGEICTLEAVANEGYTFINWTLNGEEVATTPTYTFMVEEAGNYVANFVSGVEITASCNPETAATITGAGFYNEGTTCTLTATPVHESYTFLYWILDGAVVSEDETYSFTVTGPAHYVAYFSYEQYIITVTPNPTVGGTVEGGGAFLYGETCTISATPNLGYTFENWTVNGIEVSTDATYTFVVSEAGDYVANFVAGALHTINVEVNPAIGGTATGAGEYSEGMNCTLTAVPNQGFSFINWTLDGTVVSEDATYSFIVTEDATYVANFRQDLYYVGVTAQPANGGQTVGGGYFLYGHWCVLNAIPNPGYTFVNWTVNGNPVCSEPIYRFMVTEDVDVVANFTQDAYVITAIANPAVGGTISGTGGFSFGQSCTLSATANTGYTFVNWMKDGEVVSSNATYTFTVNESANYVANFSQNLYTINVAANPANAAHVFIQNGGNGQFAYGDLCTLRVATPNTGYTFLNWSLNGVVVSTEMTYTFTVTGNANYVANFELATYNITAGATPLQGGHVSGMGEYGYGETCSLTATPVAGYTFLRWTKNGNVVSTSATYTFTVRESAHYVAHFTTRAVNIDGIALSMRNEEAGEIIGLGNYEIGETVTLTVIPFEGYQFFNWTEKNEVVCTEETYTFIATEDRYLVANLVNMTGVEDNESINVSVFPNPASSMLRVMTNQTDYELSIYTITGVCVRTMGNCSNTTEINVQDLSAGTYIIRLTNGETVETRRFVKE